MLNEEKSASGGEKQNTAQPQPNPASQTAPTSPTPKVTPKNGNLKSKLPWIIVAILLVLLGVFGGYFFLNQTKKSQAPTPTPQDNGKACTQEAKICPDGSAVGREGPNCEFTQCPATPTKQSADMKTYTSAKLNDLSFSGYSLEYPADWTLSEQRDESTSISTVTLTKDGYTIKIWQAATGGAGCIYEGDMPEGPASDYRNNKYKDLKTGFATLRQTESPSSGKMSYNYCQKSETDDSYGQPTSVGHMSVSTQVANPDPEIVSEFEKIIESIKTL